MKSKMRKIGISLLIALCFILPTGAVLADRPEDADALTRYTAGMDRQMPDMEQTIYYGKMLSYDGTDEIPQDTNTDVIDVFMEKMGVQDAYSKLSITGHSSLAPHFRPVIPMADGYNPVYQLLTTETPTKFQPVLDIYLMECVEACTIYQTSFEDNARNYMEWIQIDANCDATGGYYDGWSWSSARASDGEYSFKCTMYGTYKNMQMDYLSMRHPVELGCSVDDWDDVGYIHFSFDTWVEGEYQDVPGAGGYVFPPAHYYPWYHAKDFLVFQLNGVDVTPPITDTSMPIAEPNYWGPVFTARTNLLTGESHEVDYFNYFTDWPFWRDSIYGVNTYMEEIAGQPGWWRVTVSATPNQLITLGLSLDNIIPQFYWESDKERTFEGAYVDNFIIDITPVRAGEKVYQGHSQQWLTEDDVNTPIGVWQFPLAFTDFRETIVKEDCQDVDCSFYRAIVRLKTDDGGYTDEQVYDFEIGSYKQHDIIDLEIRDDFEQTLVPDGGVFDYGSDAHIKFTYHNDGSEPVYDVPVTAAAYNLVEKEVLNYNMETGFDYYYFLGRDVPYLSSDQAFIGSQSLAFNDPDTKSYQLSQCHPVTNDVEVLSQYAILFYEPVDMTGVKEAYLDFYMMAKLGTGVSFQLIGGADAIPGISDLRDFWHFAGNQKTAADPYDLDVYWWGPMQPHCSYVSINLVDVWNQVSPYDDLSPAEHVRDNGLLIGFSLTGPTYWSPIPCKGPNYYQRHDGALETDWSGVYIDGLTVTVKTPGEQVWGDTMILPGPIAPGETVTKQFQWDDPDYSHYRVKVSVPGCDSYKTSDFVVLGRHKQMSKLVDVDHVECVAETWCISNVVGNHDGNSIDLETGEWIDGPGDHYALATNCETNIIPAGVNDYISLNAVVGNPTLHPIDVSHLYIEPPEDYVPPVGPWEYCQPPISPLDDADALPFSDTWTGFRMWEWFEADGPIETISFTGIHLYGVTDDFDNSVFKVGFSNDATGPAGPVIEEEFDITVNAATDSSFVGVLWGFYNVYEVTLELPSAVDMGDEGYFSVQMDDSWDQFAWLPAVPGSGDGITHRYQFGSFIDTESYDLTFCLFGEGYAALGGGSAPLGWVSQLYEDFSDGLMPPTGWTFNPPGTFSLGPIYGEPSHTPPHHAYTFAGEANLITPTLTFGDESMFSFWYAVEDAGFAQDLEVYLINHDTLPDQLVWADYGFTHEGYVPVELLFDAPGLNGTTGQFQFIRPPPSDWYGLMVDTVEFETRVIPDVPWEPGSLTVNFTYQVEIEAPAYVVVEYALTDGTTGYPDGDFQTGDWQILENNMPWHSDGIINGLGTHNIPFFFSGDITLDEEDHWYLYLRVRLFTQHEDFWSATSNSYISPWGIGFHMHEIWISDLLYDRFDNRSYHFYEDFESGDLIMGDQPGQTTNLQWTIDCVSYPYEWQQVGDVEFFLGEQPPEYDLEEFGCKEFTLIGQDGWGDGWSDYPDPTPVDFIDVYVNGVPVIVGFTVYGSSASATFTACGEDNIILDVYSVLPDGNFWVNEQSFQLIDEDGTVWVDVPINSGDDFYGIFDVSIPEYLINITEPAIPWDAVPFHTSAIWEVSLDAAYEAYLFGQWAYDIPAGAKVYFEVSADGGNTWFIISEEVGPKTQFNYVDIPCTMFDLSAFTGRTVLVRVRVHNYGTPLWTAHSYPGPKDAGLGEGWLLINSLHILDKKDVTPPTLSISLSGSLVGPNVFDGPVTVTLTATDDKAMGQIHYTLNDVETVVPGDRVTFTVTDDGTHTVTAWPVDAAGNVGSTVTRTFFIDSTPPSVSLIAPEPGLYLFGNKLLSMAKPFIIGGFTAQATASDEQGVSMVEFLLNGDLVGADTTEPYSMYIAVRNMGAATLTARAVDGVGNTAQDSMDITYYKFL